MERAAFHYLYIFVFMFLAAFQCFPTIQLKKTMWLEATMSLWYSGKGELVSQSELLDYNLNDMVLFVFLSIGIFG